MVNPKNVLAIIPARGGSKSIPRKNIKLLAGHPLLAYSIAAGRQAASVGRVIVSTDDSLIAEVAQRYGAEVPFIRPSQLAQDDTTDFPVMVHALKWLEENEAYKPEIIVQLRPTSPFRPPTSVDESVQLLVADPQADSVRSITRSGENPYKMWRREAKYLTPLLESEFDEPYNLPRQKLPPTFWQTGHIDTIRYRTIMEKQSLTGDHILPLMIDPYYAVDIDTPDQWVFAEWLIAKDDREMVHPNHLLIQLFEGIKLIVFDFDGVFTDNTVIVFEDKREAVICNRGDGMGLNLLRQRDIQVVVLSTEVNPVVSARCEKLNLPCYQGIRDKSRMLDHILQERNLTLEQVAYVGNDVNDLECLKRVKLGIAVADAHPSILRHVDWILSKPGGKGAVRELCDLILSATHS
ncbi:MAG: acylneuraminate cytidylyltransferase [Gemmatimonadetes bacterium]|nr:MAG: acylneuraminate cytidylyltransferase [Gemmatimonadota bacterium]